MLVPEKCKEFVKIFEFFMEIIKNKKRLSEIFMKISVLVSENEKRNFPKKMCKNFLVVHEPRYHFSSGPRVGKG